MKQNEAFNTTRFLNAVINMQREKITHWLNVQSKQASTSTRILKSGLKQLGNMDISTNKRSINDISKILTSNTT